MLLSEIELASARWYSELPMEQKSKIMGDGFKFVFDTIGHAALLENPFLSKSGVMLKFCEVVHKHDMMPESFGIVEKVLTERSEAEWQQRFKTMKKNLGWSYDDMATFVGAASGDSVKASVNRQLPAFAKLAVCVFEQLTKEKEK